MAPNSARILGGVLRFAPMTKSRYCGQFHRGGILRRSTRRPVGEKDISAQRPSATSKHPPMMLFAGLARTPRQLAVVTRKSGVVEAIGNALLIVSMA
jgi:hypothetical protein